MVNKKSNIWDEFATEVNGDFIVEFSWHSAKTEVEYKGLKIIFDNYTLWSGEFSTEMTRVIVGYTSLENFKFKIYKSGLIADLEKLFGGQDVKIGRHEFDKKFIIKTNNEHKIKTIFQNKRIRDLIEIQKNVNLEISDEKGIWEGKLSENQFELSFYEDGKIKDIERLKLLLNLFKEFVDELLVLKIINNKD